MIDFNSETHQYFIDGKRYPCISDITSPLDLAYYSEVPSFVLNKAAARGTLIHKMCEEIDLGKRSHIMMQDDEVEQGVEGYIDAYREFLRHCPYDLMECEQIYGSASLGYCGTIDRLYEFNNEKIMVDIKTGSSINLDNIAVKFAGYANLIKEKHGFDTMNAVLHLRKDGTYSFIEFDNAEEAQQTFAELLEQYNKGVADYE